MKNQIYWPERKEQKEQEYFEEIIFKAVEEIECGGYELGSGRTADVCALEGYPNVCVKIINKITPRNDALQEMELLWDLKKDGFQVPTPICCAKTEKGQYLFMEQISGFSLLDLVEEDLFDQLPKDFDFKDFFARLREMLQEMHEKKRIYHRDLRAGNVMVDNQANPVIIDFGESKKIFLSTEDPYREDQLTGTQVISKDEDRITELYREIGRYLKEKGAFNQPKQRM